MRRQHQEDSRVRVEEPVVSEEEEEVHLHLRRSILLEHLVLLT
jgi:hypothetical protein